MGYLLLDRICTTAGSHLYRARHLQEQNGALPTLKLLHLGNIFPAQAARFRREYEMLRALNRQTQSIAQVRSDSQAMVGRTQLCLAGKKPSLMEKLRTMAQHQPAIHSLGYPGYCSAEHEHVLAAFSARA